MASLLIKENNKFGYINEHGDITIQPQFDSAKIFFDGVTEVKINGKTFIINENGDILFQLKYETTGGFSNDRCIITVDEKKGFINKKGEIIIDPIYYDASLFENGFAVVSQLGPKDFLIDVNGKIIFEHKWLFSSAKYKDGLINAADKIEDSFYVGFVNLQKEWKIPPIYKFAYPFHEELSAVQFMNNKFGFINKLNEIVLEPKWNGSLIWFSEGLCPVWENGFGFIDKSGKEVIPTKYYHSKHFSNGLALTRESEKGLYGYINKNGDWAIEPKFNFAESFCDGIASVEDGYITPTGEYIYKTK